MGNAPVYRSRNVLKYIKFKQRKTMFLYSGSLIHFFRGPWRGLRFHWLLKGIRTLTQSAVRYHKENNHLVHRDTSSEVLPVRLIGH